MKKIILIVLIYFINQSSLYSIEPDVFVQSTVNRASKILSENISKDKKIDKLKLIAKETVDIKGIGFYTLGSTRKSLDENNKRKYSLLFESYFLKSFSSRLAEYTNPEIDVVSKEFPEFVMAFAEENWIRGYHQALDDVAEGERLVMEEAQEQEKKQCDKESCGECECD